MLSGGNKALESVIDFQREQIIDLCAQFRTVLESNSLLAESVRKATSENQRLREKCEEMAAFIKKQQEAPTQFSSGPLYMSEEEEDAWYDYQHGNIHKGELAEKLKELGLDPNIDIE